MTASTCRKRLLIVLAHGRTNPSATVRALIFDGRLKAAGYDVRYVDHYSDMARVFRGLNRVYPYFSERYIAQCAVESDVVFLCKVTSPSLIRRIRQSAPKARLVMDFGDALWLQKGDAARLLEEGLRLVDFVTTDNEYTAAYIRRINENCMVIPDCPQVENFDRRRAAVAKPADGRIVLGWVGSPSTTYNLFVVWEALERLFGKYPQLELRLLGADPRVLPPFEKVRYSLVGSYDQARMVDEVLGIHIGLFPLQDTEACRVRGVLKATVYMSGAAVAACSPIGENNDLIMDGVNGLLCADTDEWVGKIERLIADPALRDRLAQAGLKLAQDRFTMASSFERLHQALAGPVATE
jgi:glycosyltransferase involved in cell wall biosynthesis